MLLINTKAKSKGKIIAITFESVNFDNEKMPRTDTKNEANKIKSDNFTRFNREKSNISIAIMEKRTIW